MVITYISISILLLVFIIQTISYFQNPFAGGDTSDYYIVENNRIKKLDPKSISALYLSYLFFYLLLIIAIMTIMFSTDSNYCGFKEF